MSRLDALVQKINKEYKEDIAARGINRIQFKKIPTSSMRFNYCLYGGIPRNCIIEFAGEEGSGKTTTSLDVCRHAQELFAEEYRNSLENVGTSKADEARKKYLEGRGEKKVLYVDCENTLDEDWARLLGVNVDNMYIIKPQTQAAEQVFQMVKEAVETDEVGLVVIDSLGVMVSQQAFDKDLTEKTYGGISQALTLFSKEMVMLCRKYDCTLIGINQLRDDMSGFGRKITPGGRGWKFNCTLRVFFEKGDLIDETGSRVNKSSESPAGNKVMFSIAKTKADKPNRLLGYYYLMYDYGIDSIMDVCDVAEKLNIVQRSGSWYSLIDTETGEVITDETGEELKFQGSAKLYQYLYENESILNELVSIVESKLK